MTSDKSAKKVVLITGASSGIGKETALTLIREGHIVYGAARRIEKMQALVDTGGHALPLDVMDHEAVAAVVQQIVRDNGRIDVLVNNAGYASYGAVEDTSIEDARRQFEVNIFGLAAVTKAVLPHMREQHAGTIINISSMGGKIYTPLGAWYHATKHALEGWSDCLRLETASFGIDVVIVEPGSIATEFGEVMSQPMLERSKGGPYERMSESMVGAAKAAYERGDSSPPSVIANVISKAIGAKRPKTRYAAGKYAKPLICLRRWLSDRAFDRIVMSQLRRMQ
jgi:short-subunit dehydrogenase